MQVAQIGPHQLAVPGAHEAEALTDCCQRCMSHTPPAAVLDEVKRSRITGRIAVYRCKACAADWLCWWAPPGHLPVLRDRKAPAKYPKGTP